MTPDNFINDFNDIILDSFTGILEDFPIFFQVNKLEDLDLIYASKNLELFLNATTSDIQAKGPEYVKEIVHPFTYSNVFGAFQEFLKSNDANNVFSFLQMVRSFDDPEYHNLISFSRANPSKGIVITFSFELEKISSVHTSFDSIIGENRFLRLNHEKFTTLTPREKKILTEIVLGLSNEDIADKCFISLNTVKNHRKSIIKKLNTNKLIDFYHYAKVFRLIEI